MSLTEKEINKIRQAIEECHRPLIFFDDDCDGLSSFLQVYNFVKDGKGVPVKDSPQVDEKYARRVEEYQPDLVIILDKPRVQQEFLDRVKQRVIWIDHHEPQEMKRVEYYNPRIHDDKDNRPTSYWIYKILEQDLWIAMTGIIADWFYPEDLVHEFREKFPGLLPEDIIKADQAIHDSKIGLMTRIWSFNMKGTVRDTMASVKTLTRVKDPYEVLDQTTSKGNYIYKKYDRLKARYQQLVNDVKVPKGKLLVFTYVEDGNSFTADLSNEMLYKHPDKVIIIGRMDNGYAKCSLRSADVDIASLLQECLKGVDGYGGGHKNACGACINEADFARFLECFEKKL